MPVNKRYLLAAGAVAIVSISFWAFSDGVPPWMKTAFTTTNTTPPPAPIAGPQQKAPPTVTNPAMAAALKNWDSLKPAARLNLLNGQCSGQVQWGTIDAEIFREVLDSYSQAEAEKLFANCKGEWPAFIKKAQALEQKAKVAAPQVPPPPQADPDADAQPVTPPATRTASPRKGKVNEAAMPARVVQVLGAAKTTKHTARGGIAQIKGCKTIQVPDPQTRMILIRHSCPDGTINRLGL